MSPFQDTSDVLHDRVFQALGQPTGSRPKFPFQRIDIQPEQAAPLQTPTQDLTPSQPTADVAATTNTTGLMSSTQPTVTNPYAMNPTSYKQPITQPLAPGYGYGGSAGEQAGNPVQAYGGITQPLGTGMLGTHPPSMLLPSNLPGAGAGGTSVNTGQAPLPSQSIGWQPGVFNPAAAMPISSQTGPPPPTSSTETWNDPPPLRSKKVLWAATVDYFSSTRQNAGYCGVSLHKQIKCA